MIFLPRTVGDFFIPGLIGENMAAINNKKLNNTTRKIVGIAVFSALAFVVSLLVRFPVQFLTFDAKDAIITVAAFIYGPIVAPFVSFFAASLELIISDTLWYGFIMNFVSSAVYSLTASLVYKKVRSLNGALIGIFSAVIATTGTMMGLNVLITPLYMEQIGVPMTAAGVVEMIPTVLLPFNFAKTLLNSAVIMLIYKPLNVALSRLGIGSGGTSHMRIGKSTVVIGIVGTLSLIISLGIFYILA